MAALIAPLTLTSCSDDFLDVTPPDKATLQEYYSNKEHIMEAVASTYNPSASTTGTTCSMLRYSSAATSWQTMCG